MAMGSPAWSSASKKGAQHPLARNLLTLGDRRGTPAYDLHRARNEGEDATTAVRLRADTAVAKARDLIVAGWRVVIECPDGIRNYPDDFDNLISVSRDDSTLPSQYYEIDLGVAV
jgi:hypothetical protein